eukprot:1800121-Pleurochrysis_carterae.AAC.1
MPAVKAEDRQSVIEHDLSSKSIRKSGRDSSFKSWHTMTTFLFAYAFPQLWERGSGIFWC